jgi:hypothetical protein
MYARTCRAWYGRRAQKVVKGEINGSVQKRRGRWSLVAEQLPRVRTERIMNSGFEPPSRPKIRHTHTMCLRGRARRVTAYRLWPTVPAPHFPGAGTSRSVVMPASAPATAPLAGIPTASSLCRWDAALVERLCDAFLTRDACRSQLGDDGRQIPWHVCRRALHGFPNRHAGPLVSNPLA